MRGKDEMAIPFRIQGDRYRLSRTQVLEFCQTNEVPFFYLGNRNVVYSIHVDGRKYPVKWVVGGVLDIDLTLFTTQYATRILERLGFDILDDWQSPRTEQA